jgi:hypothetical protein
MQETAANPEKSDPFAASGKLIPGEGNGVQIDASHWCNTA